MKSLRILSEKNFFLEFILLLIWLIQTMEPFVNKLRMGLKEFEEEQKIGYPIYFP